MSNTQFYFRAGEGELIETVVTLSPDEHSSIHGYVKDSAGHAQSQALVMLFRAGEEDELSFHAQAFTDETGQFIFGPLTPGQLYMIKVFKNAVKVRELQLQL